jgi:Zinc finger, C3HC4 type (RING finger)
MAMGEHLVIDFPAQEDIDMEDFDEHVQQNDAIVDLDFIRVQTQLNQIALQEADDEEFVRRFNEQYQRTTLLPEGMHGPALQQAQSLPIEEPELQASIEPQQVQRPPPLVVVIDDTDDEDDIVIVDADDEPPPPPPQARNQPTHMEHAPPGRAPPTLGHCYVCYEHPACVTVVGCGCISMCGVCSQTLINRGEKRCPHCNQTLINPKGDLYAQVLF